MGRDELIMGVMGCLECNGVQSRFGGLWVCFIPCVLWKMIYFGKGIAHKSLWDFVCTCFE